MPTWGSNKTRLLKEKHMATKYTWDIYSPFSVGLDDVFNRLEAMSGHNTSYPPYNLIKHDAHNYEIEIALAGFKADEIEVSTEQNILRVTSKVEKRDTERIYLHKGLSKRSFNNSWQLSDDVRVSSVEFQDGLLTISLEKIVPEHQKKTVYTVSGTKSTPQFLAEDK
jgi:molecular chaperone IbpA